MLAWCKRYQWELSLYFFFAALSLVLLRGPWAPQIFPEEAGYLGWANRILYGQGSGYYFLPGYSFLLLPLMAVCNDITVIYPYIVIENVLLNGLLIVGLYRLAGLWGLLGRERVLTAAVVSLYAPFVLYAQKAVCEPLLNVCGVFLLLAVAGAFEKKGRKEITACLLLSAMMVLSHSREFVLFGVWLFMALFCFRKKKAAWLSAGAVCLIGAACAVWVMNDSGTTALHFQKQITGLFSFQGFWRLGITLLTQSSYWILSTLGLAPAGIWYGIGIVKQKQKGWQAALFALLFFAATALLSALFMSHHSKAVQLVYGRYNDGALAGIFVLGAVAYFRKKPPIWLWGVCIGDVALTAALYGDKLRQLTGDIMNALGLFLSRLFAWEFDLWIVMAVFFVLGACLWGFQRKKPRLGFCLLGGLFLFQLGYVVTSFFVPENKRPAPAMLEVLDRLEEEDLALYCQDGYVREFYRYSVYRPQLSLSERSGSVEISKTWRDQGSLLGAENETFLWARDEKTAEKYQQLILPKDGKVVSPKSRIQLVKRDGQKMTVRVKNTGSPWLCLSAVGDVQKAVRLGIRMFDAEGALIEERRADFSKNMLSGDWQEFTVSLPSEAEVISFELVQEFQNWFSQLGDEGALAVNRKGEAVSLPEADQGFHVLYPEFLIARSEKDSLPDRNNLEGFYETWTGAESSFCHLNINCSGKNELVVETAEGTENEPSLNITINDSYVLEKKAEQPGRYVFSLGEFEGEIQKITIRCRTFNPFEQSGLPEWMSFLSLDSHIRPVQLAVHGIRKIFGTDVNNHEFGVNISRIVIQ